MKYAFILCDGLSDRIPALAENNTPLTAAKTPCADKLAAAGKCGIAKTTDPVYPAETLRTDMYIIGCDSKMYPEAPALEAISCGIPAGEEDVVFGCRLISLSDEEQLEEKSVIDCAPVLSAVQLDVVFSVLDNELSGDVFRFFMSDDKRLYCVWKRGESDPASVCSALTAEENAGKKIGELLPKGDYSEPVIRMIRKSFELLSGLSMNKTRLAAGKPAVNAVWFEELGSVPKTRSFEEKYGLKAAMLTSDRRLDGLASVMEMKRKFSYDESLEELAANAVSELENGADAALMHIGSVYTPGLEMNAEGKIKAIEALDSRLLEPIYKYLSSCGEEHRIILISSFSCCCSNGIPSSEPVPFLIYDSRTTHSGSASFTEQTAFSAGSYIPYGTDIMKLLLLDDN